MTNATEHSRHWSSISETTTVTGIRILYFLYRLGGRFLFWISLWPVIVVYWATLPGMRRVSRRYLEHAHACGAIVSAPTVFTTFHHFFRFADTLLDKLLSVGGRFKESALKVAGREALFEDPRGAVLVTAHMGCLELCQVIAEKKAVRRLHILTHTQMSRRFMRILTRLNPTIELSHIEVSSLTPATLVSLSEKIAAGDYLVIVGDRTPIGSDAVSRAQFMTEEAPFPNGFALLATLLQCPLWSMLCRRETEPGSAARYRVTFEKLWEPEPVSRKARAEHFARLTQRFANVLQKELTASPFDWFNFFDFWHQGAGRHKE